MATDTIPGSFWVEHCMPGHPLVRRAIGTVERVTAYRPGQGVPLVLWPSRSRELAASGARCNSGGVIAEGVSPCPRRRLLDPACHSSRVTYHGKATERAARAFLGPV